MQYLDETSKTTEWPLFISKADNSISELIQVYALTSNAEEAEAERFYDSLKGLLELTLQKLSFSSVQFSWSVISDSLQPHELQHDRPHCPSPTPGIDSNTCPLSLWCHPTISSPVIPFSHLQSFPASVSFPVSQFFASGGQNIRVSALASVLPLNIYDGFPLGWISLVSFLSKGRSRVFSNTTVQKHQFFSAQLSL